MAEIIECDRLPERDKWYIAAEKQDFLVIAKGSGLPSAPLALPEAEGPPRAP